MAAGAASGSAPVRRPARSDGLSGRTFASPLAKFRWSPGDPVKSGEAAVGDAARGRPQPGGTPQRSDGLRAAG